MSEEPFSREQGSHPDMLLYQAAGQRPLDSTAIVLGASLLVGLLCVAAVIGVGYARHETRQRAQQEVNIQFMDAKLAQLGVQATAAVGAAQTREAQQAQELAQLGTRVAWPTVTPLPCPTLSAWGKPPLALIWDVPCFKQEHNLSCEPSVAAMAAHFYGIQVSEGDILAALPRHENPHKGFRGNVDGSYGGVEDYGVYAGPLQQVLTNLGLRVEQFSGDLQEIRRLLLQGKVLIAWATFDLQVQVPQTVVLTDGETVTLVPYEHTFLIVGYNSDGFWVNDPYTGAPKFLAESEFSRSFGYLDNMALVVGPKQ